MQLVDSSRDQLLTYVGRQLDNLFPDGRADSRTVIDRDLDEALDRLKVCIDAVRMWPQDRFNYLHSEQNTIFLYYLANTIWRNRAHENVCTKLFYLNKALNGFHCFYDTELPDRFFIGHSLGIVLVRLQYPTYLVLYQNSTVGRQGADLPDLAVGTVLYPNSAVVGRCKLGPRTVVAQGCSLVNTDTPGDCIVFAGNPAPVIKPLKHDPIAEYFRV